MAPTTPAARLDPEAVRRELHEAKLRARHALSQNFLAHEETLQAILDLAAPAPGRRILEVGPGLGILTGGLLAEPRERGPEILLRHRPEGVDNGTWPGNLPEIERSIDHGVLVAAQQELTAIATGERDHLDASAFKNFAAQIAGENLVWGGLGGQRRDLGLGNAPLQPLQSEIRDRRNEDQDFAQHDEDNGKGEHLAGQASDRPRVHALFRFLPFHHLLTAAISPMNLLTQELEARRA